MRRLRLTLVGLMILSSISCMAVSRWITPVVEQPVVVTAVINHLTATVPQELLGTPTEAPTSTLTVSPTTPPTATNTPTETISPTPSELQLLVFDDLWQVVKDEYLYDDFNGQDWDNVYIEYRAKVEAGITDADFYRAMDEMIYLLGDEHSIFLSPEDTEAGNAEFEGRYDYAGIGVLNQVVAERNLVTIVLVFPGSPAEQAGLRAHDNILAVDGKPILDENGARTEMLRGSAGSQLTLTVQSPGSPPRQVELTRQVIASSLPVPYEVITSPSGKKIGYIVLASFNDVTINNQFANAIRSMTEEQPLDGLILDNRQNGGGADVVMENVLANFTSGNVGYFVNRDERRPLRIIGRNINGSQDVPLVVLVGKETVSFGEIFSGILQDIGRAHLIGDTTDGNVEILWVYEFTDGSSAWIAHDTFQPLNNVEADWETKGIVPDQIVSANWDEVTLQTDPAIQAALEYLE